MCQSTRIAVRLARARRRSTGERGTWSRTRASCQRHVRPWAHRPYGRGAVPPTFRVKRLLRPWRSPARVVCCHGPRTSRAHLRHRDSLATRLCERLWHWPVVWVVEAAVRIVAVRLIRVEMWQWRNGIWVLRCVGREEICRGGSCGWRDAAGTTVRPGQIDLGGRVKCASRPVRGERKWVLSVAMRIELGPLNRLAYKKVT